MGGWWVKVKVKVKIDHKGTQRDSKEFTKGHKGKILCLDRFKAPLGGVGGKNQRIRREAKN
jgi:hypothetical protein